MSGAKSLAVVDTDVLALLLSADADLDDDHKKRRAHAEQHVERLVRKERVKFGIPAPVMTELIAKRPGETVLSAIADIMGKTRILALNSDAAIAAGEMMAHRLKRQMAEKKAGDSSTKSASFDKVRVKFDILIAGIAHRAGAKYLLTGNPRDYKAALADISSGVEVIDAWVPAPGQQTDLFALMAAEKGPVPGHR